MRVLFVSGIDGACHRYQVLHRAAQLRRSGAEARVRSYRDPRVLREAAEHDVLFLYRVPATEHVRDAIDAARRHDRRVVGSIDDLVFSPDAAALPNLASAGPEERALWRRGVERYRATLAACDVFLGPTEPLVVAASALGWDARLHRNALSPADLLLADRARGEGRRARREVVLGYFSGTPTHDDDFASIGPALAELLRARPEVRLRVLGPLRLGDALARYGDRIERQPLVEWSELPGVIAGVDVNLAPIDTRRRFTLAKGEVKYLEAGAVATPTVASDTPAFRYAIGDGERGRLARDEGEWLAALDELVRDADLRRGLGERARADVLDRWTEEPRARELRHELEHLGTRRDARVGAADAEPEAVAELALEPDAHPALRRVEIGPASPPIGDGQRLVQSFRPVRDGLCRVDVHAITYGQALRHELSLRLLRADGSIAAESTGPASRAPDRGWLALELAPERSSAGRSFAIEIAARASGPANALSLGLACGEPDLQGSPGEAHLDGEGLGAPLALRAYASWEHALPARSGDVRSAG
jgi:glycosyltransferase involved in cell wall biosynthesis